MVKAGKYDAEPEPMDYDRPPGEQQQYYRQQVVAGQPIYQYGPPPPPVHGGRMGAYRSGQETAIAREERGQNPRGGFSSFFGSGGNDGDDESVERIFMFNTVEIRNRFIRKVSITEGLAHSENEFFLIKSSSMRMLFGQTNEFFFFYFEFV